jgi:hypothetical protein
MRKALPLFVVALATLVGCRGWPDANADIRQLRDLHRIYREYTAPKNKEDAVAVEKLAQRIDSILEHMEELTK